VVAGPPPLQRNPLPIFYTNVHKVGQLNAAYDVRVWRLRGPEVRTQLGGAHVRTGMISTVLRL
jgi:hypothetical protein